ncbi:ABC transporter permease [Intrasporangium mesophilum]
MTQESETLMTTIDITHRPSAHAARPVPRTVARRTALTVLARRRLLLSAHTPREIVVPLLTPILFALVIAPALATMVTTTNGLDYQTYVAVGTVGLLVPLSSMFAGIGVIVDRDTGARRELLAAPVPRSLMVGGNFLVALAVSSLQLAALVVAAIARGAHFHTNAAGVAWFVGGALLFMVASYAIAEIMANRIPSQEEYVGATPAVAILPWFLAGSLFPISALPGLLSGVAKVLPLTHALALMRYGLLDTHATGLHDIWGMSNANAMAAMSLAVVAGWAVILTAISVRVFAKAAVH